MRAGFSDETLRLRGKLVPEYLFRDNIRVARHEPQTTETRPRSTGRSTALGSTERRE